MKIQRFALILLASTVLCGTAFAQSVQVTQAWVRATVQGQKASGAFMTLTAKDGARLMGISSPVAGVAEVHEMKMDGGVMQMRAVQGGLDLPAGKAVVLSPGGFHVMLMDLKTPLKKDSTVALSLVFKDAKGVQSTMDIKVPVAVSAPAP